MRIAGFGQDKGASILNRWPFLFFEYAQAPAAKLFGASESIARET